MTKKTLCIVGAGPKAAAIAARAAVLRSSERNLDVPEIVVLEKAHVGAAWSGHGGYSTGFLTLCSPPEKDVGYPYVEIKPSSLGNPISIDMFRCFSWNSFLVQEGVFPEWVDRGREFPSHSMWAKYLKWVFEQAQQEVTIGTVSHINVIQDGRWQVNYLQETSAKTLIADGIVLTGVGKSNLIKAAVEIPDGRIFNAESFWNARDKFLELKADATIAVLGDGGAAGTIIAWLASALAEKDISIISINPLGTLLPRGDGYSERRWFSDPSNWSLLSIKDRRALMNRTEAGVISLRLKQIIDGATNVTYEFGRGIEVKWVSDELEIVLSYDDKPRESVKADYLIQAIGFDNWSLLDCVSHPAKNALLALENKKGREKVELAIQTNLELPACAAMGRGLHVPSLAAIAQGPGMATLGCLGLLAGGILTNYVNQRAKPATEA